MQKIFINKMAASLSGSFGSGFDIRNMEKGTKEGPEAEREVSSLFRSPGIVKLTFGYIW